jgi:hypothetical protein
LFTLTTIFERFSSILPSINELVNLSSYYIKLVICSFIINFILLKLIIFFGVSINNIQKLLKIKYFFLCYFIFIVIFLLVKFYFAKNSIYLDIDKISITAKMGDFDLAISLKDAATFFNHFGEPAIFIALARLGYSIALKHQSSLNLPAKLGVTLGTGAGGLITYNLIQFPHKTLEYINKSDDHLQVKGSISLKNIDVKAEDNYVPSEHPVLTYLLGINPNPSISKYNFQRITTNNNVEIQAKQESVVLKELVKENPNLSDKFKFNPGSPLEPENELINLIIEAFTNLYLLGFIYIYLLFMLAIILICKFLLNNELEFKLLSKLHIFN